MKKKIRERERGGSELVKVDRIHDTHTQTHTHTHTRAPALKSGDTDETKG